MKLITWLIENLNTNIEDLSVKFVRFESRKEEEVITMEEVDSLLEQLEN